MKNYIFTFILPVIIFSLLAELSAYQRFPVLYNLTDSLYLSTHILKSIELCQSHILLEV